jgi:UDP-N-acetylmuramate--alanine ligase
LGLSFTQIAEGLEAFRGTHRRFEIMGERDDILFVDDYAHHPSEIQVTLAAARLRGRRVVAIFQPHRYSRSQLLLAEFATAFKDADAVVITDIYSAGEVDTGLIDGRRFADAVAVHHPFVTYEPTLEAVKAYLRTSLQRGDLALFLGAGNLNQTIPDLLKADSTAVL